MKKYLIVGVLISSFLLGGCNSVNTRKIDELEIQVQTLKNEKNKKEREIGELEKQVKDIKINIANNKEIQIDYSDFKKAFPKNLSIEQIYKKSKLLPDHHTLCIPVIKYFCTVNKCISTEPKIFNLIGGTRDNPNVSRCDSIGCDTYNVLLNDSGEYKNIQPIEPKGFIFKMSYNTIDKKYVEFTSLGLDSYISYGYCMYDFEIK